MSVAIFYPEKSRSKVLSIFGNFCEFLWIFVNFCQFLEPNIGQLRRPISRAIWGLERCSTGLRNQLAMQISKIPFFLTYDLIKPVQICKTFGWLGRFCPDQTSNDLVSPSSLRSLGEITAAIPFVWRNCKLQLLYALLQLTTFVSTISVDNVVYHLFVFAIAIEHFLYAPFHMTTLICTLANIFLSSGWSFYG